MSLAITEKKYKRLSIQIYSDGFSFCCFDTLDDNIISFNDYRFESLDKTTKFEDFFADFFNNYTNLKDLYDDILIIHDNTLVTFVPESLFDESFSANYLQYNVQVFENDFFAHDEIENNQIKVVYIPYSNINNFFIDKLGSFDYKHAHTILVSRLLTASKNNPDKKMFVNLNKGNFQIIVIQNQKLLFYNSFEYETPEDFLYYILFTAEHLDLNPEEFPLELIGIIDNESDYYQLAYKYIRNVSLFDVSDLRIKNSFAENENRAHFILFNS